MTTPSTPTAPGGRPSRGGDGLGRATTRGAAVTLGTQGVRLLVQVAGLAVLGRLLSPDDYGLVAIVLVLVSLGELLRDFGLSSASIQARSVSTAQRNNLFWINTGLGTVIGLALCVTAPLLARVYDDPRLAPVALALSGTFLLNGASAQYRANHARSMQFGKLSGSELAGQVVGLVAAIGAALAGFGYWALVVQQVAQQATTLALLVTTGRWLPGRFDKTASVRSFLTFGSALAASHVINNLSTWAAPLALGATATTTGVGVFNRAQQLVTMPMLQVQVPTTRVALPVLSRLQDDPARYQRYLLRAQFLLLSMTGLAFAVLFAQADAVVAIVLGDQWIEAVPVLRLLLVAGFFQAAGYASFWVFLSQRLTHRMLVSALLTRPLLAAAVVYGAFHGPLGAATAYAAGFAVAWPITLLWLRHVSTAPVGRMLLNGLRAGLLVALAGGASLAATEWLPPTSYLLRLVLGGVVALAVAAIVGAFLPFYRSDRETVMAVVRGLKSKGEGRGLRLPRAVDRRLAGLRRVLLRSWAGSGVPSALDRAAVRRAWRNARKQGVRPHGDRHLLVAAPGGGNIGDQALLEAVLEGTGGPVVLAVKDPRTVSLPPGLAGRVTLLDAPDLVYGGGSSRASSLRAFGAALAGASHCSVIGADVMDGRYTLPRSLRRSALVAAAARCGVDTRVIGFSWPERPRRAARRELARAGRAGAKLLLRDPVSARRARRDGLRGVVDTADVVFSSRSLDTSAADRLLRGVTDPVAIVNASGLVLSRSSLLHDHVAVVEALRERGLHVLLLPHVSVEGARADDVEACRALHERTAGPGVQLVTEILSPAQVRSLAARARIVVTGRMHLAVMASMSAVPAVTLATQGKVEGLCELLRAPQLAVAPEPGFARTVVALLDEVLPESSTVRSSIRIALPQLRQLALRNLDGLPSPTSGPANPGNPHRDDLVPTR